MKLSLTSLFFTLSATLMAGPVYSVTDLGSLGGSSAVGYSINNHGETVGSANDIFGTTIAFRGQVDASSTLANNAVAWEINDRSQVAGIQYSNGNSYAMLWSNTGNRILGGAGSAGLGINESGRVTGMTSTGHVFLTGNDGEGVRDLGTMAGGNWSVGHSVNEQGQVAGYGMVGSNFRAFRWSEDAGFEQLRTLGGRNSYGMAINGAGQVVGASQNQFGYLHATLWNGSYATDLGTLDHGLSSYAYGINLWGATVGYSLTASGETHAFIYQDGVLYDLNLLLSDQSGWLLEYAYGINDNGQIVGEGLYHRQMHAFRLDLQAIISGRGLGFQGISNYSVDDYNPVIPGGFSGPVGATAVPEPSTWGLALAGLALCTLRQMRRN